jgi:tRNA (mo5U34)-methyltransferase
MEHRFVRRVSSRLVRQLDRLRQRAGQAPAPTSERSAPRFPTTSVEAARSRVSQQDSSQADSGAAIDWFHSIDFGDHVTNGVKSVSDLEGEFACLGLDRAQLKGRTVLDIGTADGWNALRCESLGASVTAIDAVYRDGLRQVRRRLAPKFRFFQMDLNGPSFLELGQFDVVLYLGVLYHSPYPYEQLVRVADRCRDTLFLESAYLNLAGAENVATLTFNFDGSITPDLSSPVFPSVSWILQSLRRIGFRQVDVLHGGEARLGRVIVRARDRDPRADPLLYAAEQVHV